MTTAKVHAYSHKSEDMSNKEITELSEKFKRGLEIAERRMLEEKALRGQNVIVCDTENNIQHISARQILSSFPVFK